MWNTALDDSQAGIKIARKKHQQLQICRQYHSNGRKWRGANKKPLKGKRGEWKSWLFWIQHSNNEYHGIWSHHFMTNRWGKSGSSDRFSFFLGTKITENGDCSRKIKRLLLLWKENYEKPRQHIKKQRHHMANKGPSSQSYGFSSSHVLMWDLDHKEGWAPKNWHLQTVVLEKTLESPLDCKEIKPVNPKGNQPWIFIGRTGAKAEASILWPPDAKSHLIGKDPDAGKDWRQNEKRATEDEMVR